MNNLTKLFVNRKNLTLGITYGLLAASLEATVNVVPKPLLDEGYGADITEPMMLVSIIYIVNCILFTPFARKDITVKNLKRKTVSLLVIIGFIEVLSTIFFLYGLRETTAINATILLNSEIVFGIMIAFFFLMERIQRCEILPIIMIIIGSTIIPFTKDMLFLDNTRNETIFVSNVLGDSYVLIAGLLLGLVTCLYRYIAEFVSLSRIMQITSGVGAMTSILFIIIFDIPITYNLSQLPSTLFVGIFGIGISAFCYIYALKLIGAVRTIIVFSSTAIFGIIFANVILLETVSLENIVSIVLVIGGIVFLRNKVSDK